MANDNFGEQWMAQTNSNYSENILIKNGYSGGWLIAIMS